MIEYSTAKTTEEFEQILKLQQKNLPQSIPKTKHGSEGFVTVYHSLELLARMNDVQPHIIAKAQNQVVGYTLCMHPRFRNEIEVLKPMFKEIESSNVEDYIVMGQICIAKDYRRIGIFRKLYEVMKTEVASNYNTIITEVNAKNTRSLSAHYAIGFKDLRTYHSHGQDWKLIVLK